MIKHFILVVLTVLLYSQAWSYSPVARVNCVPYQHVENGTTFKLGVVAFSKPGISAGGGGSISVAVTPSSGSYTGTNPLTTSTMALNSRTETWEYFVVVDSSDFSVNTLVDFDITVTDDDSNTRVLSNFYLYVDGASDITPAYEAWVDIEGSDGSGTLDSSGDPYISIASAISAIETANGNSDNCVIYLVGDTYSFSGLTPTTDNEWLEITAASGASKENVIVNTGVLVTDYLKVSGITLQSQGSNQSVINDDTQDDYKWVDDCRLIGSGRYTSLSNPVHHNNILLYHTDNYIYDVSNAVGWCLLARNITIDKVGNDAFFNTLFVINSTVTDISKGETENHSDVYQVSTGTNAANPNYTPPSNRIIYNLKATDVKCQGFFSTFEEHPTGVAQDNAIVNMIVEMRNDCECCGDFTAFVLGGYEWDHLLLWNNTFPYGTGSSTGIPTNSSIIGNVFWQFLASSLDWSANGNSEGNTVLHNHYMNIYGETPACTPSSADTYQSKACPRPNSNAPDSGATQTYSSGDAGLDMTPASGAFLYPENGSPLINGLSSVLVPVDNANDERGSTSDIGAYEYTSGTNIGTGVIGAVGVGVTVNISD